MPGISVNAQQTIGWLTTVLGGSVFGVLTKDWLDKRRSKLKEPAEMTRAAAELMDSLSDGGKELLEEFRKEFRYMRKRINELEAQVEDVSRKARTAEELAAVADARAVRAEEAHATCEQHVLSLQEQLAEINEMMKGRVARYGEPSPTGEGI